MGPLEPQQQRQLKQLIAKFADIFAKDNNILGKIDMVQHQIHTGDAPPKCQQTYRVPPASHQFIREEVQRMLNNGLIQPSRTTDASHIAFGAILLQLNENGQEQVIVYASRTLKPTKLKYGSTELEAAVVIWALKHF
ncbi:hypothetical protein G9A89_021417 [Geosiphon pyriformis]|nr:hypothetical protein G9A89_021417 [Geosiphon pyriformis]